MTPVYVNTPEELEKVFADVESQARETDFEQTFRQKVFPRLEEGERDAFAQESSPGGTKWPPLAPATVAAKGHDVILIESGRLLASLTGTSGDAIRDAGDRWATFGTGVEYAAFHQEGTARIPQREHTGMNDKTLDGICEDIADQVVAQLLKG